MIIQLDRVRKVVLHSKNLLRIDSKFDEAIPFSFVFFNKLEDELLDFAFTFDSSFVPISL